MSAWKEKFAKQYVARLEERMSGSFVAICAADPTGEKLSYARPVAEWFLDYKMTFLDLPRVSRELALFHKHKEGIPPEQRDIYKLISPAALTAAIASRASPEEWRLHLISTYDTNAVTEILDADPTRGYQASDWMLRMHRDKKLILEDLPTIAKRIEIFLAHQADIDPKHHGLAAFDSPLELYEAVKPHMAEKELWENSAATEQVEKAFLEKGEIEIWGAGENFRVLQLRSKAAAIHYGDGTDWCTAYTGKSNAFHTYCKHLLLIQTAAGRRYQLHFGNAQCMDEYDAPVKLESLCNKHQGLAAIIVPAALRAVKDIVPRGLDGKYKHLYGMRNLLGMIEKVPELAPKVAPAIASAFDKLGKYIEDTVSSHDLDLYYTKTVLAPSISKEIDDMAAYAFMEDSLLEKKDGFLPFLPKLAPFSALRGLREKIIHTYATKYFEDENISCKASFADLVCDNLDVSFPVDQVVGVLNAPTEKGWYGKKIRLAKYCIKKTELRTAGASYITSLVRDFMRHTMPGWSGTDMWQHNADTPIVKLIEFAIQYPECLQGIKEVVKEYLDCLSKDYKEKKTDQATFCSKIRTLIEVLAVSPLLLKAIPTNIILKATEPVNLVDGEDRLPIDHWHATFENALKLFSSVQTGGKEAKKCFSEMLPAALIGNLADNILTYEDYLLNAHHVFELSYAPSRGLISPMEVLATFCNTADQQKILCKSLEKYLRRITEQKEFTEEQAVEWNMWTFKGLRANNAKGAGDLISRLRRAKSCDYIPPADLTADLIDAVLDGAESLQRISMEGFRESVRNFAPDRDWTPLNQYKISHNIDDMFGRVRSMAAGMRANVPMEPLRPSNTTQIQEKPSTPAPK